MALKPIYPCIWLDGQAQEAARFYTGIFDQSQILSENPVVTTFDANGQTFMLLNGGPNFKLNPSISIFTVCETLEELDHLWDQLLAGGMIRMPLDKYEWSEKYGWLEDRYGVNWQLFLGKMEEVGQKFTPCLLFTGAQAGKAEKAVQFYTSVFKDSSVTGILKYGPGEPEPEGLVKHSQFRLGHSVFMAMDSSLMHGFGFNEALSLVVECDSQEELDYYWVQLTSNGGEESRCGWLKDKYGVSWQIVPAILKTLMSDPERAARVTQAFLQMKKMNIESLLNA